jgi:hypothetical protein
MLLVTPRARSIHNLRAICLSCHVHPVRRRTRRNGGRRLLPLSHEATRCASGLCDSTHPLMTRHGTRETTGGCQLANHKRCSARYRTGKPSRAARCDSRRSRHDADARRIRNPSKTPLVAPWLSAGTGFSLQWDAQPSRSQAHRPAHASARASVRVLRATPSREVGHPDPLAARLAASWSARDLA